MVRRNCLAHPSVIARCARPNALFSTTRAAEFRVRPVYQAACQNTEQSCKPVQDLNDALARPRPQRTSGLVPARNYHSTPSNAGIAERLGDMARHAMRRTVEPYSAFGMTRKMYQKCTTQAAYRILEETRRNDEVPTTEDGEEVGVGGGLWHDELHLLPSFSTWTQVTMMHMYLIITRFRCFDRETYLLWQSMISDHFFQEAEDKMDIDHHISSRGLRQRYLKDLFMSWRGVIVAYDEGLMRGDAVLAAALWRNLFKGRTDIDLRHLASVVAWMRRSFAKLDRMSDEQFIRDGGAAIFQWSPPSTTIDSIDLPATKELGMLMQQAQQQAHGSSVVDAARQEHAATA